MHLLLIIRINLLQKVKEDLPGSGHFVSVSDFIQSALDLMNMIPDLGCTVETLRGYICFIERKNIPFQHGFIPLSQH